MEEKISLKDIEKGTKIENREFLISRQSEGISINGSKFYTLELKDKSGSIFGKIFNVSKEEEEIAKLGNYIYVSGEVVDYNGNKQIKIKDIKEIEPRLINKEDFISVSPIDYEELLEKLKSFIGSIQNDKYKEIVRYILNKYKDNYLSHPAGVSIHHSTLHGLLMHSINVAEVCDSLCKIYSYTNIDRDLLISSAIIHDIGKIFELTTSGGSYSYSLEGHLLGHISIGYKLIDEASKELNIEGEEPLLLEHLILSHHGKLEFGSPVRPCLLEAEILSKIDDLDAKINSISTQLESTKPGAFTPKMLHLDNITFYKPKNDTEDK